MKIKLIGDKFTCRGFRLAGIDTVAVEDESELKDVFQESIADQDMAILFITEKKAEPIKTMIQEQKMESELPLIVEIPDKEGWQERGKVLKLINRTLSIDI
ncbi:MAG: V-type ATP synthase subunit F [Candidatus Marinimicrobia bacterium]|nr:V-type ATP synthase subunit F [Candidatus Neomarinimicrobiota bacterium]